jgi:hypothetical protein
MVRRSTLTCRLFIVVVNFLLLAVAGMQPAWAQFETRATAMLPSGAVSVAGGDFNHDGYFDVVIIDDNGFTVSLGKGDGTFQKYAYYATTQIMYSVAVGDFNNDGNLDIVFANLDPATVTVYLGNGDGTFKPPISSDTTEGSYFLVVGDFNNDKKLDLAVIDPPYISVLLGNGDGTFQAPSDNDSFLGGIWLATGDFNNDHKLDVIVTGYSGSSYNLGVLLGNGGGKLQNSITTSLEYVPATVAVGDLNGDGKLDAVVSYDLDGIAVFLGNGDGIFQTGVNYNTTGLSAIEAIVADLNRDGKLDVMIPTAKLGGGLAGIDVFWGNGDGTIQPAQFLAAGLDTGVPVVGDLNGDGRPDVALANDEVGVITMLNTGEFTFSPSSAPLEFLQPSEQTLKITNSGKKTVSLISIKESGAAFQMHEACGSSLRAGASCDVSVLFKPKGAGTYRGLITLIDGASSRPQFIELSGFSN